MIKSLNRIARKLLSLIFRGMLISVPLMLTLYVIITAFNAVDHIIPSSLLNLNIPGLGVLVLLSCFIGLGWLGGTILAQPIFKYFNRLLDQVPLIKTIYNSIKDMLSAFVGQKKSFNRPVLVKLHKQYDIEQIGFVTTDDLSALGIFGNKVAVYLPYSYSVAGVVYIVPAENVTPINQKAPEVMKFVLSGGVASLDKINDLEQTL